MPFQLPIEYRKCFPVQPSMITDLELIATHDGAPCMYDCLYDPKTEHARAMVVRSSTQFTDDTAFLGDTVTLLKKAEFRPYDTAPFLKAWQAHHQTTEFNTLYHYIEYSKLQFLNAVPLVLLVLSVYSMMTPVLFLLSPIMILLVPFALMQMSNKQVGWEEYKTVLYSVLQKHALGALFVGMKGASPNQLFYLVFTAAFFCVQFYSNIQSCIQFYKSVKTVHSIIDETRDYVGHAMDMMKSVEMAAAATYDPFVGDLRKHYAVLEDLHKRLKKVQPFAYTMGEVGQLGTARYLFYQLRNNEKWKESIEYSLDFVGYVENMASVQKLLTTKKVNACKFGNEVKFSKAYYPPYPKHKKNSYAVTNSMITGPNASGKTTFIKTAMLNVLFSQQVGLGFYKRATLRPYQDLCCYLNIPDTSGRDSLFQAEARRCKEILEKIGDGHMLCIFDELFSGTNPFEASASAYAFLDHLTKQPKVTFLLTTHFLDVCERMKGGARNMHMESRMVDGGIHYEYKFKKGVSKIKGGLQVLKDLGFPRSIIECAQKFA
jgi:hypothetical protein